MDARGAGDGDGDGGLLTLRAGEARQSDETRLQPIRAFLLLWSALRTGEEHFGGGTPIGHIHVQPGEGDGVLDYGRNGGRRRRQILGSFSGSVV